MTGAPKQSAMQILAGLEGEERGIYSGAFGWIGDDGAADLAMVIRSVVVEQDAAWVGAGGASRGARSRHPKSPKWGSRPGLRWRPWEPRSRLGGDLRVR